MRRALKIGLSLSYHRSDCVLYEPLLSLPWEHRGRSRQRPSASRGGLLDGQSWSGLFAEGLRRWLGRQGRNAFSQRRVDGLKNDSRRCNEQLQTSQGLIILLLRVNRATGTKIRPVAGETTRPCGADPTSHLTPRTLLRHPYCGELKLEATIHRQHREKPLISKARGKTIYSWMYS